MTPIASTINRFRICIFGNQPDTCQFKVKNDAATSWCKFWGEMLLSLQWNSFEEFTPLRPRGGGGNLSPNTPFVFQKELKFNLQLPKLCYTLFNFRGQVMPEEKQSKQFQNSGFSGIYSLHCITGSSRRWEKQTYTSIGSKEKAISYFVQYGNKWRNQK